MVIDVLLYLLILCIVFGLIYYIVTLLPLPEPFRKIAIIIILVIFLIILLTVLLGGARFPRFA